MKYARLACLFVMSLLVPALGWADGTFISAPGRTDMVHDEQRNLIYISAGDRVLRYDVASGSMLDPIVLGGTLEGLDISPDGNMLAVADALGSGLQGWVHLVDLNSLVDTKVVYTSDNWDNATNSVAFTRDGHLLVASAAIRRLDLATREWDTLATVRPGTLLASSADGSTVAFVEPGSDYGDWGVYYPATGAVVRRHGYDDGTMWYNYEVAVNADGSQITRPTYAGSFVYDSQYQKLATIGVYASGQPIGLAYDPVRPIAYFPWLGSRQVRVYDMQTFQQVGSYDFEDTFAVTNNTAYKQGRTRLSADGSLLMVSVTGGVRFVRQYNPLVALPVSLSSDGGRVSAELPGSIGIGTAALTYEVREAPAHGHVAIAGDIATYLPVPGYRGEDAFVYAVHYGPAVATATVTITVDSAVTTYSPRVQFDTLPALQISTPTPGSTRAPGDFNGDGVSDLLWFNPGTSQVGYWTMALGTAGQPAVRRSGTRTFNVTPGYFVGASGDLTGDGYADLVFTSAARDLWLWSNSRNGGWRSTKIGSYPDMWQLVGAGDVNGDGYDDLLWLDPSDCQFGYWLMKGNARLGMRTQAVTCGYYPIGLGYYTPTNRLSVLWTSSAGDLYVWDSASPGFRSYDLTGIATAGGSDTDIRHVWAFGGGVAGKGIGLEWRDSSGASYGRSIDRIFGSLGRQTGLGASVLWTGTTSPATGGSAGYLVRTRGGQGTGLYVIDSAAHTIRSYLSPAADLRPAGQATSAASGTWTFPDGWYVVGAPANGAAVLPWR